MTKWHEIITKWLLFSWKELKRLQCIGILGMNLDDVLTNCISCKFCDCCNVSKLLSLYPFFFWTSLVSSIMFPQKQLQSPSMESRTTWPKMAEDILVITFFIIVSFTSFAVFTFLSLKKETCLYFYLKLSSLYSLNIIFSRLCVFEERKDGSMIVKKWAQNNFENN